MTIQIDTYLGRDFDLNKYNCWDFVRDVWRDGTGTDIGTRDVPLRTRKYMDQAMKAQVPELIEAGVLVEIPRPEDPCIVFFSRPGILSHVGVYTGNKVLHIQPRARVVYEDIRNLLRSFPEVKFYK